MKLYLTIIFILFHSVLNAQNEYNLEKRMGLQFAQPFIFENLPEGRDYRPQMLLGYYTITDLLKKKKSNLYVYLEPQLVLVSFNPKTDKEIEFGANLGFEYQVPLFSEKTYFTLAIGSGPHFITVETDLQTKGYIFSDNFEAGFRQKLGKSNLDLLLKCRFRHISNADLKLPNGGIDNWFIVLGLTKKMKKEFNPPKS